MKTIPITGPWITKKEIDYVTDAVSRAWYSDANIYHDRFEKAFANYLGVKYTIALPSCTSAIHLSLLALGIGHGDEVIVPDITWIASAAPISYVNAIPVFCDIDAKSWCISADSFEKNITGNTKAAILVDLYGNMPEMEKIENIARKYNIALIEDAAQAIGSEYKDRKAGSFGNTGVFSFHGSKTMTTGEGGMLVTDNENLYEKCLFLSDHGRSPDGKMFWNTDVAYKYKMSSMQAALGLAQLERIDDLINKKRLIFKWYKKYIGNIEEITLNHEEPWVINAYWMVTAIFNSKLKLDKIKLMERLAAKGISTRPFFYPLSSLPAYRDFNTAKNGQSKNLTSYQISPYGINLPCGLQITEQEVEYICKSIIQMV